MKKRILVLADSDLSYDARIQRQLGFLRDDYSVFCLCWKAAPVEGVEYIEMGHRPVLGLSTKVRGAAQLAVCAYEAYYSARPFVASSRSFLDGRRFDLILANDVETLPLALDLSRTMGAKVFLDAHEYAPRQFENSLRWRLLQGPFLKRVCTDGIPKVDGMITVCDSIARLYEEHFGILPGVITNAPAYSDLKPLPTPKDRIRLIYHGAVNSNRRNEVLFEVLSHLSDRFTLDMMVSNPDSPYCRHLKSKAGPKVQFVSPVPHPDVARTINAYDVGLYLLEPRNVNQRLALPNKLFEFVQGRLAVAVGPSDEMAAYVRKYDLGIVSDSFKPRALAMELERLTPERIDMFKRNADSAARELCAEENGKKLRSILKGILDA